MSGIIYRLRTGCQGRDACGVRQRQYLLPIWPLARSWSLRDGSRRDALIYYDDKVGTSGTGRRSTAPASRHQKGDPHWPQSDRSRKTRHQTPCPDRRPGIPLAVTLTGANIHDMHMVGETLDAVPLRAARGTRRPKNLCLDKRYDYESPNARPALAASATHSASRESPLSPAPFEVKKARRWVVERTNSWHNNFRALRSGGNAPPKIISPSFSSPVPRSASRPQIDDLRTAHAGPLLVSLLGVDRRQRWWVDPNGGGGGGGVGTPAESAPDARRARRRGRELARRRAHRRGRSGRRAGSRRPMPPGGARGCTHRRRGRSGHDCAARSRIARGSRAGTSAS